MALASVAPQAARARRRGRSWSRTTRRTPQTRALAERHGARYLAHGAPRGLNAARNTAIEAAAGRPRRASLDDDVEVWPGWLGALLAGARASPEHDAFGGPIRARLEGTNLHACGREPLPVTDARPRRRDDRDAEFVWGANLALRRSAARAGRAASTRRSTSTATRRTGSGACTPPAGASATSPRPASTTAARGEDARLGARSRAPRTARGRSSRRYDARKGTAPAAGGRAAHAGRLRLAHGRAPLRQRHRDGRPQRSAGCAEALAPDAAAGPHAADPDYLVAAAPARSGAAAAAGGAAARRARRRARRCPRAARARRAARRAPRRRVLVARPSCGPSTTPQPPRGRARARARSRHDVDVRGSRRPPAAGQVGEPQRARWPPTRRRGTTGCCSSTTTSCCRAASSTRSCSLAERFGFALAQPAHASASHAAWEVTRRRAAAWSPGARASSRSAP